MLVGEKTLGNHVGSNSGVRRSSDFDGEAVPRQLERETSSSPSAIVVAANHGIEGA